jgi:hypothetical protein
MIAMLTDMSDMDLSHSELGYGWVGPVEFESSHFGSWHTIGAKPVFMVLRLATGKMPVSVVWFWL